MTALTLAVATATSSAAAQLTVTVTAPDTVRSCEPFDIQVVGSIRGGAAPRFIAPVVAPFTIVSSHSTTQLSSDVFGRSFGVSDVELTLLTDRPGRYTLPRFEMQSGRIRARGAARTIVVVGPRDTAGVAAVVSSTDIDTAADVALRAMVVPETVYVGEQASYQVGVFISPAAREKLRSNPSFIPPQLNELMAYDYPADRRRQPIRRRIGSQCYDVLVYERALFPLAAGRHDLAPAELSYSLAIGAGFFAGSERRETKSEWVTVNAIEPPDEGRPAGYAGAVGDFTMSARVDSAGARVGDPMTLTLHLAGEGNIKLLPRPALAIPWASLVPGDERVVMDSIARRIRGAKEFDWIVTPRVSGVRTIPSVAYSFWNPKTRQYQLVATDSLAITVGEGTLASLADTSTAHVTPKLGIRRTLRPAEPLPPPAHPIFAAFAALAPIPALSALAVRRRRLAPKPVSGAARLRTATRRRTGGDPAVVRRALIAALVERGVLAPGDLLRQEDVVRSLRRAGVSLETASTSATLLEELSAASYARTRRSANDAGKRARAAYAAIDAEARDRSVLGTSANNIVSIILAAAALSLAGTAVAFAAGSSGDAFARGVHAFDASQFTRSAAAFDSAASLAPRAVDAWANSGTAHWAAHDTAEAVAGWQHALRLDPLDGDVRARLDLTPGPARGALASVPPVPLAAVALAGLALWWAAWVVATLRIARGSRAPGAGSMYTLHGLVVAALVAYVLVDERLGARSLSVVAEATQLRAIPSLAADPATPTRSGNIVRVIQRDGRWSHVATATGEDGWIENDRLLSLRRD
ncbi:MAG: hypothetical protein ACJ79K_02435 [Gemmatimonadaceae bacterium]